MAQTLRFLTFRKFIFLFGRLFDGTGLHKTDHCELTGTDMQNLVHLIDTKIFKFLNQDMSHESLDSLMMFLSDETTWLVMVAFWLIYCLIKKKFSLLKKYLPVLAVSLMLSDAISFRVLKPGFERLRPCYQFSDVRQVSVRCGSDFGFPSNHAANSFAFAVVMYLLSRNKYRALWFMFAIIISYTRIYLGVHFPGDVLFGAFIGALIAYLVCYLRGLLMAKYSKNSPEAL